jgi:hypothetical protein
VQGSTKQAYGAPLEACKVFPSPKNLRLRVGNEVHEGLSIATERVDPALVQLGPGLGRACVLDSNINVVVSVRLPAGQPRPVTGADSDIEIRSCVPWKVWTGGSVVNEVHTESYAYQMQDQQDERNASFRSRKSEDP